MTTPRERIPPGQRVVRDFPVLHVGPVPGFDERTWDLHVEGQVELPVRWTWPEFLALPQAEQVSDFHCVTGFSRLDCRWQGVPFRTVAEIVRPKPDAGSCTIITENDYSASLPLARLLEADVMLACGLDGAPLSPEHGGPVRLVVPKLYAYKSVKWVRALRFTARQERGYWEARGYSNQADPWKEQRYSSDDS